MPQCPQRRVGGHLRHAEIEAGSILPTHDAQLKLMILTFQLSFVNVDVAIDNAAIQLQLERR